MSQFIVTGPCYVQVGMGADNQTLVHLGWSESGFEIEINGYMDDVMCDVGGSKVGTDVIFQGEDAIISGDLNFYNEDTLTALESRLYTNKTNGAGAIGTGMIGGLMIGQGNAYRLLVYCPYNSLAGMTDQVACWNFPTAWLTDTHRISTGTKVKKHRINFRAIPSWTISSGGGLVSSVLYNSTSAGMAPAV